MLEAKQEFLSTQRQETHMVRKEVLRNHKDVRETYMGLVDEVCLPACLPACLPCAVVLSPVTLTSTLVCVRMPPPNLT